MSKKTSILFISAILMFSVSQAQQTGGLIKKNIDLIGIKQVKITDSFWGPKLNQWGSVTANDVLNKQEDTNYGYLCSTLL